MARNVLTDDVEAPQIETNAEGQEVVSYTAVLLMQGEHRFYTLAMPSEMLAETCVIDPRSDNPIDGFQRLLDRRRAQEIAYYIDSGFGTIPARIYRMKWRSTSSARQ